MPRRSSARRGDWRHELLDMLGARPTPQNLRFLSNWQRWEGGHTNNDATYNWLNTTMDAPGAVGSINDVGVKAFRSRREGVNALAMTILNGKYTDIVAGLKSGNPFKHNLSAGLSTWVSGSPTGNLEYAAKILGKTGVPKAALPAGGRGPAGNPGLAPAFPGMNPLSIAFDDDPEFVQLLQMLQSQNTPSAATGAPVANMKPRGKGLTLPLKYQGTHVTDNLGWGTKTAIDIMGDPGTPIRAPLAGVVLEWNPTGAQGGGSMLVRYANGRKAWIGHITRGLRPGTQFRPGTTLALISPDHPRPHVHLDTRG